MQKRVIKNDFKKSQQAQNWETITHSASTDQAVPICRPVEQFRKAQKQTCYLMNFIMHLKGWEIYIVWELF